MFELVCSKFVSNNIMFQNIIALGLRMLHWSLARRLLRVAID